MASEAMLHNYMMSHRTELENDQKGVAAMQQLFKELELEVSEAELQAEVNEAERNFKVSHTSGSQTSWNLNT